MGSSRLDSAKPPPHPYKQGDEVWVDRDGNNGRRAVVTSVFWDGSDPYVNARFRDIPWPRPIMQFSCARICRVDAVTRLGELDG